MELRSGKHLTFFLGNEEYGIPISGVREIIGVMEITPVPKAPAYIRGVINLRGKIVPVIDLRLKLGMLEAAYNEKTCTIVVETVCEDEKKLTGVIVDTVSEVVNIQEEELETIPNSGTSNRTGFSGLGKIKGKVILLIDTYKLMIRDELNSEDANNGQ